MEYLPEEIKDEFRKTETELNNFLVTCCYRQYFKDMRNIVKSHCFHKFELEIPRDLSELQKMGKIKS